MKLVRILSLIALVAVSAAVANAGSIKPKAKSSANGDPTLTIKKPGGGLATKGGVNPFVIQTFGNSVENINTPLLIPFSIINNPSGKEYEYIGPPMTLPSMWVEITGIPLTDGQPFTCLSDFFSSLGGGNCGGPSFQVDGMVRFHLFGNSSLQSGDIASVTLTPSATPEPSTLLMFLSLGPAIGFAKKRWNARQSA